jgi:valyl-tRNA synthetase
MLVFPNMKDEFPQIPEALMKPYSAPDTESRIYAAWEKSGLFNPDECIRAGVTKADAEVFSMVLPPPNVTGTLHMGSALMLAVEDVAVRYARMQGKQTLWIPGTDSAAIATQARVEKDIQKSEGKSRHDLGREELLRRIDIFVEQNKNTMIGQMRSMGASLDWSRYAYTMDEKRYHAVMEAFIRMHDAGLIYRGNRIVNWDPRGQTTISDDEIVYEERKAVLYTFKYSPDFPIAISTTRPETKVGDTAVAVHPDDARYKQFVGQTFEIADFCGIPLTIKIIADESVEPDYGTGALGVTPAHSMTDWEIADRHNLPRPQVINEYAKIMIGDDRILNKKTTDAREIIAQWLRDQGLMIQEEEVSQNVSTAERTSGIVEPLPKLQWFIDVNKKFTIPHSEIPGIESGSETTLKEIMRLSVESGETRFVTERFEKTYTHWAHNLRDWCISRQIWFGHRIPVWYKDSDLKVSIESPGSGWEQDSDVLDTWFSSALWTFSTLGWPEKTDDLQRFHPTTLIESGYDILPFWIARMIMMSGFYLGQVPFRTIYFHGMMRDQQGRKISKSLGNNIDPVDMGAKYGMDAVRFSLIVGTAPGTDSKIDENKIKAYSKFANKIWNASRFVLEQTYEFDVTADVAFDAEDQQSIDELSAFITEITKEMDEYKFYIVSEKLYHYFWHTFADILIERSKTKITDGTNADSAKMLLWIHLTTLLKALHPFMPFVTEEIWRLLKKRSMSNEEIPRSQDSAGRGTSPRELLMIEAWPASQ